jgi:hypothetical protein
MKAVDDIIRIIGLTVDSAAARETLSRFGKLRAYTQDLAPHEGMPPRHYLVSEKEGLEIRHRASGEIDVVFLHSGGTDGFSQFRGPLIGGLSFATTAAEIRLALGPPAFSAPPRDDPILGKYGESLRYDFGSCSIHFQLGVGGRGIDLVTVIAASTVPE